MKLINKWFIFTLVGLAQFMVVLDNSITNVALPAIRNSLHFSTSALQWVVTAYALTFGGFLLLGGRAADQFGRRRTLQIGVAGFTLFSLLIGISHSATLLIVLRALQGVAAAFMSPAALSIVLSTFHEGTERNRALSMWTIISAGGGAVGLLIGGALTQFVNWRWNFFINVPVGIALSLLIPRIVPKHEAEDSDRNLDLPGAALVTTGIISLVYALSQAPAKGWLTAGTLGTIGAALVLLVGFVMNESRAKHPLMPLRIFKIRNVAGGNMIMAPIYAGMLGMFFLASLYVQNILHYSPFMAGLAFLPFPIIIAIMSRQTPKLVGKYGFKPFLIVGPLLTAIGLGLLTHLPMHANYWFNLLPTFILMPFGVGLTFMPVIAAATSGVPAREAGLASGLLSTSQQMGGALGLAILSGVAASTTKAAASLGQSAALIRGYEHAFIVSAGLMVLAAILGATVITGRKHQSAQPSGRALPVAD